MTAFIKHIGRHSGTGQRLTVVFMQLPDDKEHSLVVYSDSLPDRYHDDFMAAVESPEGQQAQGLYEVLTRKVFWHGTPMLETLHTEGHLVKVPTSTVIMTPNSNTNVPLNDILAEMGNDVTPPSPSEVAETPATEPAKSQVDSNVEESKKDESKAIAQNLLIQADLLEQDAMAKREEAYKYDPSLKPGESQAKVRITTGDDAPKKRGRGRPRKSEA